MGEENTLRWFGHIEEFPKKIYVSDTEDPRRRGRPVSERVTDRREGLEQARKECMNRERWKLFCHGYSLGEHHRRERGVRNYR